MQADMHRVTPRLAVAVVPVLLQSGVLYAACRGSLTVSAQPDRSHVGGCSLCASPDAPSKHVEQGGALAISCARGRAKVAS